MILLRAGHGKHEDYIMLHFSKDNLYLSDLACYGFFLISLVQIIGILLGTKAHVYVCKKEQKSELVPENWVLLEVPLIPGWNTRIHTRIPNF